MCMCVCVCVCACVCVCLCVCACLPVCACALQMRAARLEQLDRELQEARGSQEVQLQVRLAADVIWLHQEPSGLSKRAREKNVSRRFEFWVNCWFSASGRSAGECGDIVASRAEGAREGVQVNRGVLRDAVGWRACGRCRNSRCSDNNNNNNHK